MASRLGIVAALAIAVASCLAGSARTAPAAHAPLYTVLVDPRLCPSPLCGGYWVALANGVRTTCADGMRRPRCYVAKAVDVDRREVDVGVPNDALVRGHLETFVIESATFGLLVTEDVYAPAGKAVVTGGYYRVVDTGVRCIRAPCFSFRVTQVNGSTRTFTSSVDLGSAAATKGELARANAALRTKNGLFARGRFGTSPNGGRVFRASRLYVRATQPRA